MELGRRLHKRGLDNEETIFQRLANAKKKLPKPTGMTLLL